MASPQQQAPNNKNSKWKQKLVDLTLEDDSEESSDHGTSKCNHFCKKLLNSKKNQELFPSPPKKKLYNGVGQKSKASTRINQ